MTKALSVAIGLIALAALWVAGHAVVDPKGAMTIAMSGSWSVVALVDDLWVTLLGVFGLICAVTTWRSQPLSAFLKILIGLFSTEAVIFGAVLLLGQIDQWPVALNAVLVPDSLPASVAIFSILIYAVSFIPVVRSIMHIADPYFLSHTRSTLRIWPLPRWQPTNAAFAKTLVVILVLINQAQVGINVRLSFFSRDWGNAIQAKDADAFWHQLLYVFTPWAFVFIAVALAEYLLQSNLVVNWRRFLTDRYLARWLDGPTHYRMAFTGVNADNPDQRIAEDVNAFIAGGDISSNGVYTYTIQLISTLSSLVSFAVILWNLSNGLSGVFTFPGTSTPIPGFLFWVALIYAAVGTVITHFIGRPLVALFFLKQRFEANFRFSLARLREYGEQVALLHGEERERQAGMRRFGDIFENYISIMDRQKKLIAFQAFYGQISPIIPYIITAPFYFIGKITLGIMSQTAGAFSRVEAALNFFVTYYVSLANFRAILNRLTTFEDAIRRAHVMETNGTMPEPQTSPTKAVALSALSLKLPDGRVIVSDTDLSLAAREPVLITGPSGSGKSTLFRAIAGIWPLGQGRITVPAGARIMLLPQKPYIPIGTLRAALSYPADANAFSDDAVLTALQDVGLPRLTSRLDEEDNWNAHLSGGEQQRVAVARALLARPDWLFLDEATAALDEASEAAIYTALETRLPDTTVVSIGHRSSLERFHERKVDMQADGAAFRPVAVGLPAE